MDDGTSIHKMTVSIKSDGILDGGMVRSSLLVLGERFTLGE